jgi:hypothetical protein
MKLISFLHTLFGPFPFSNFLLRHDVDSSEICSRMKYFEPRQAVNAPGDRSTNALSAVGTP